MRKSKTKILALLIIFSIVLRFAGWRLSLADAYWQKTDIIYAAWRQPYQVGSNWSNMYFEPHLLGSVFGLLITGADFSEADLSHTDITAKFQSTKFTDAILQESSFFRCIFKGCDLRNADLKNARLQISTFWDVDLRNADLEGADLSFVNFYRSDRRGANLKGVKLHLTAYDSQTKWPKGFNLKNDMLFPTDELPPSGGR